LIVEEVRVGGMFEGIDGWMDGWMSEYLCKEGCDWRQAEELNSGKFAT